MLISTFRGWLLLLILLAGSARAQRLAAGYTHTVSIHPDGTLWTWGTGYLGNGTLEPRPPSAHRRRSDLFDPRPSSRLVPAARHHRRYHPHPAWAWSKIIG